jgi:hypothetical protein
MQVSDQLSATMLEFLYAGVVVLAGEWLPYDDLKDNGIFLIWYSYHDLSDFLQDVAVNLKDYQEQCRVNRMLVDKNYSWSGVKDTWKHL